MSEKQKSKDGILGQRKIQFPVMSYDPSGFGPRINEPNPVEGVNDESESIKYLDEKILRLERQVEVESKEQQLKKIKEAGQGQDAGTQISLMAGAGELLKASAEATKTQSEMWMAKSASPTAESTAVQTLGTIANTALQKAMAPQGIAQSGPSTEQLVLVKLLDIMGNNMKGGQEPVVRYVDAKVDSMTKDIGDLKSTFNSWVQVQSQQTSPEAWLNNYAKLKQSIDTLSEPKGEVRQGISDTMALELKKIDIQLEQMKQNHEINMKESDRKYSLMEKKFTYDQQKSFMEQRDKVESRKELMGTFKKIATKVVDAFGEEDGGATQTTQPQGYSGTNVTKIKCGQCDFEFPVEGSPIEVECPRCGTKLHQESNPGSSPGQ